MTARGLRRFGKIFRKDDMLGQKFDEALALAADLHRDQIRKDVPIPYISHLMAVAGIDL